MSTEDESAAGPPAAASVGNPAVGYPAASDGAAPWRPRWLRPTIVSVVISAHGLALIALANVGPTPPPAEKTIEVNVVAAGDQAPAAASAAQASSEAPAEAAPEQSKAANEPAPQPPAPDPAPAGDTPPVAAEEPTPVRAPEAPASPEAPPASAEAQTEPLPPPPSDASPAPVEAAPAPVSEASPARAPPAPDEAQIEPPPPVAALTTAPPPPASAEARPRSPPAPEASPDQVRTPLRPRPKLQAKLEPTAEPTKPQRRPEAAERPKPRKAGEAGSGSVTGAKASAAKPGSAEAHRVGEASGQAADIGISRAAYAALVVAQIQAHKFYPESARARGEQGAVGVSFTIGPSGRVGSAAIVRSSGFAELDSAAREILRSISPPPPPGGSFSASTTIRFHFE